MADLQDIANRGVAKHTEFADILAKARAVAGELHAIYDEAIEAGLFGEKFNDAKSAHYLSASIDGHLVQAGIASAEVHVYGTKAAQRAGVDTPSPNSIGYVKFPQPMTKSGGR